VDAKRGGVLTVMARGFLGGFVRVFGGKVGAGTGRGLEERGGARRGKGGYKVRTVRELSVNSSLFTSTFQAR
jgi:hypothetical protein